MYEVVDSPLGKGIRAARAFGRGEVIMTAWGTVGRVRTRHSMQIDRDAHLSVDGDLSLVNHSCEPNCGLLIRTEVPALELHALRPIEPGEELSMDYASFEDHIQHMTGPCLCGSSICRGRITGYDGLPAERRAALRGYIAAHLHERDALVSCAG